MHTDTERLDWVLQNRPEMEFEWRTGEHWVVFWVPEVGKCITLATSHRECIDLAMDGKYKRVDS